MLVRARGTCGSEGRCPRGHLLGPHWPKADVAACFPALNDFLSPEFFSQTSDMGARPEPGRSSGELGWCICRKGWPEAVDVKDLAPGKEDEGTSLALQLSFRH